MCTFKQAEGENNSNTINDIRELEWTEWYYVRGVLAPFTVITNLTVVISSGVILNSNVQPRIIYMFMGNLALADLLHGGMSIADIVLRTYTQDAIFYVIQLGLNLSSILASCLGICVIAIDRYIFLKYSIHYSLWMTKITAKRIIIGVWIYSYTVGFICELIFSQPVSNKYVDNRFITITPMYLLDLIACSLVLPICITVMLYTLVLITVFKVRRRETTVRYSKYKENKNNFTRMQGLKIKTIFDNNLTENITPITIAENIGQDNVCSSVEDKFIQQMQNNFSASNVNCEIVQEIDNISIKNSAEEIDLFKTNHLPPKLEKEETKSFCGEFHRISKNPKCVEKQDEFTSFNYGKCRVCGRTHSSLFTLSVNSFDNSNVKFNADNSIKISLNPTLIHKNEKSVSKKIKHYQKRLNLRSFIMVFLVMFVFTLSWGPYCVSLIIYTFMCHKEKPVEDGGLCSDLKLALNTFLLSLGFLNALVNPFLYCWWHKGFRASLHKVCCKNNVREKRRSDFIHSLKQS